MDRVREEGGSRQEQHSYIETVVAEGSGLQRTSLTEAKTADERFLLSLVQMAENRASW